MKGETNVNTASPDPYPAPSPEEIMLSAILRGERAAFEESRTTERWRTRAESAERMLWELSRQAESMHNAIVAIYNEAMGHRARGGWDAVKSIAEEALPGLAQQRERMNEALQAELAPPDEATVGPMPGEVPKRKRAVRKLKSVESPPTDPFSDAERAFEGPEAAE